VGYSGKELPGSVVDLANVVDTPGIREEVGRRFRSWWNSVCRSDSEKIRKRLRKETTDNEDSASQSSNQSKDSANAGPSTPSGIDVVTSEQLYLATRLSLVSAKATQYTDLVALFQALGGGWWNRADVEEPGERGRTTLVQQ
jgi:hypothetical protein